jgi:hypothetical protein
MATGFQTTVNLQQAAAVEGDFASANPRRSVVSHEGTLEAGEDWQKRNRLQQRLLVADLR